MNQNLLILCCHRIQKIVVLHKVVYEILWLHFSFPQRMKWLDDKLDSAVWDTGETLVLINHQEFHSRWESQSLQFVCFDHTVCNFHQIFVHISKKQYPLWILESYTSNSMLLNCIGHHNSDTNYIDAALSLMKPTLLLFLQQLQSWT